MEANVGETLRYACRNALCIAIRTQDHINTLTLIVAVFVWHCGLVEGVGVLPRRLARARAGGLSVSLSMPTAKPHRATKRRANPCSRPWPPALALGCAVSFFDGFMVLTKAMEAAMGREKEKHCN